MAQEPDAERLRRLEARIGAVKGAKAKPAGMGQNFSQAEMAWRMVIELISGIVVGGGIGYGLDHMFGTKPILLVIFLLFGFVAGIRVVIGTARDLQERQMRAMNAQTKAEPPPEPKDDELG
ncbi:AtpZ/AtpI family protein [Gemmobacter serpentinus]|uniref:AtpZ/AtpI family protein n=1 Tax=Gemmobacter serpentinus TaxID=2652247 RepID=UPI00124CBF55|nr:AtpZ/AtpI family protein [Gemmobacter serpentinus]